MERITLDKLRRIREQYKKSIYARKGESKDKIIVHMGTCGIASGAREVMRAVLDEMSREGAPDVTIAQSSCIGLCDREPIVTVVRAGSPPVRYYRMTPEKVRRVFKEHLIGGEIVEEFTQ